MANSKSVPKIRIGSLKAAISPNDTEGRIRYTITFSHLSKDGEQWKTTQTFDRTDLLILAKVADKAHARIFKLQQGSGAHEEEQALESGGPGPPLSSNNGRAKPLRSHNQNPGHRSENNTALLTVWNTQGWGARFCWLSSGTRNHSVPCRPLCHPGPATGIRSLKKRFASPVPRRSLEVAMGARYAPSADV